MGSDSVAHIPPGGLGEHRDPSLDRLLLGANGERGHPSALQAEDPPVTNHSPRDPEGLIRRYLPGGLLQHDAPQVALLKDGVVLGQPRLHPVLYRTIRLAAFGSRKQPQRLVGAEPVAAAGFRPDTLQVVPGCEGLGAAVLKRQLAQLPTLGRTTTSGTEPLRCPGDLTAATGERLAQLPRNAGDLEVATVLPRCLLDPIALACQLAGERGAVERAQLTCASKDRPRGDCDEPLVLTHRASNHDVAVQLWVRSLCARDTSGGRVSILRRDHIPRGLLDHLAAIATSDKRHSFPHIENRLLDRAPVRRLDLLPLPRVAQRPHRRDRLRGAERHVDPAAPAATGALRTQPSARARMAALHERDEVRAVHRLACLDPQPTKRLLIDEPAARCLRHLPIRGQVVVPALGLHGLALQIAGVPAALGGTDAGCGHHIGDDRERTETANEFAQRAHSDSILVRTDEKSRACTNFSSGLLRALLHA